MARPNILAKLPAEVRAEFSRLHREGASIDDLWEFLHEQGFEVSRSAVGRGSKKLNDWMEAIKKATEFRRMLEGETGNRDQSSRAVIALGNAQLAQLMLEGAMDEKRLKDVASALRNFAHTDVQVALREEREAAAKKAVEVAKNEGMSSKDALDRLYEGVVGTS